MIIYERTLFIDTSKIITATYDEDTNQIDLEIERADHLVLPLDEYNADRLLKYIAAYKTACLFNVNAPEILEINKSRDIPIEEEVISFKKTS